MVVHYDNGRQHLIKTRDLRVCAFYAGWLGINKIINTRDIPHQDAESCRQALNKLINQFIPNAEQRARLFLIWKQPVMKTSFRWKVLTG